MPNQELFSTAPRANTVNNAGGAAYANTDQYALATYAMTGTLRNTYYVNARDHLKTLKDLAAKCEPVFIAKLAAYAHEHGMMKDVPVALTAMLFSSKNHTAFYAAADKTLSNIGQIRSFVQMVRSQAFGRKSLGTAGKRAIANAINKLSPESLYWQAISGTAEVDFADVLRLAHVRAPSPEHDALFKYLMGYPVDEARLPPSARAFEEFKRNPVGAPPRVDFRRLDNIELTPEQVVQLGLNMSWNQLRLNLNNLARRGAFTDANGTRALAEKLANPPVSTRTLPFALYSTARATQDQVEIPQPIKIAVSTAMNKLAYDSLKLDGPTVIMVDTSASMGSLATGTGTLTCAQAATYFAACIVKSNPNEQVYVYSYDTDIQPIRLNAMDSMETIIGSVSFRGGGTATGHCLNQVINSLGGRASTLKNIIILSDNQSWADGWYWAGTGLQSALRRAKELAPQVRAIGWDIQPTTTSQFDLPWALKVTGFSDAVFDVVDNFINNRTDFVHAVNSYQF